MAGVIDHVNVTLDLDSLLLRALDLGTAHDHLKLTIRNNLSNGTGSGQASQMWHDTRNLGASATENLDLAASLTNAFGVTLTFTTVKFILVQAAATNTNSVQFQRHTSAGVPLFMAALDGISLAPGEWFCFASPTTGKTVTATTGDMFTVTNSAGSTGVDYSIVIIGSD